MTEGLQEDKQAARRQGARGLQRVLLCLRRQYARRRFFRAIFTRDAARRDAHTRPSQTHPLSSLGLPCASRFAAGAGKTFTMMGNLDQAGVIPLTLIDLLRRSPATTSRISGYRCSTSRFTTRRLTICSTLRREFGREGGAVTRHVCRGRYR